MSIAYDTYLKTHINCVSHGFYWILNRIPKDKLNDIFPKINLAELTTSIQLHDYTKHMPEEYDAYDDYFYAEKKTEEIKKAFDYAWLHHLHNNPHHWQYWILKKDDSMASNDNMQIKCLEIPDNYILEMVADWWSFSWKDYIISHDKNDLYGIFSWYESKIDNIAMNPKSRQKVEDLLTLIHDELDNSPYTIEVV